MSSRWRPTALVIAIYFVLAILNTWPLVRDWHTRLAAATGDPTINSGVLWWNATHVPFSASWWDAPQFYPTLGVSSFTENLVGLSPIASPVIWLTDNPTLAYNVAYFLTWPLSALAAYLLMLRLTKDRSVAFVSGLAYGFSVYRTAELGHLQMLSAYWMPVCLLALHGFLEDRRIRWLCLFGVAWLFQSLSNGHFMLFGAVLIGMWLAYFCSPRQRWRIAIAILAAWIVASLPLVPVLLKYRDIHNGLGLHRSLSENLSFSARPHSWMEVSPDDSFWSLILPAGRDDLFPGATVVVLAVAGVVVAVKRRQSDSTRPTRALRRIRIGLAVLFTAGVATVVAFQIWGPWRFTVRGTVIRMTDSNRAAILAALSAGILILTSGRARAAIGRRGPLVFYTVSVLVIGILCFGPVIRFGTEPWLGVILSPAPYAWLFKLPGFMELRVPLRFWMFGVLCLTAAAAVSLRNLLPTGRSRSVVLATIGMLFVVEGWMPAMRMVEPTERWSTVEPADLDVPILELPIGPEWDYDATFRAGWHHRRVVNGVSGYNAPQYVAVVAGLQARDPAALAALTSLGALDVVVNHTADADGSIASYVGSFPGAARIVTDGKRSTYRLPAGSKEAPLGAPIAISRVSASSYDAGAAIDGNIETGWGVYPQEPGQWLMIDLGAVRDVAGITHSIGEYLLDFPRLLAIDVSTDGSTWRRVWEGPTFAETLLASLRLPLERPLRFSFPAQRAQFIRLTQLAQSNTMWRVSELQVHGPVRDR